MKTVLAILNYKDDTIYYDKAFMIDLNDISTSVKEFLTQAIIALDADYLENYFTLDYSINDDTLTVLVF